MIPIKRAEKAQIESFSQELIKKSVSSCDLGAFYLERAITERSNPLLLKAIEAFENSIKLNSRFIQPYLALASISLEMGRFEEAFKFVSRALEIEPNNPKSLALVQKIKRTESISAIKSVAASYSATKSSQKVKINPQTINRFNQAFKLKNK